MTLMRGRIVDGLRTGAEFTRLSWVRAQFISKLSIDLYPGTLNLEIENKDDLQKFEALKATEGIEITPEDSAFCSGKCFPVLIGGRLRGAIVLPLVSNYPGNKMELVTSCNVKETLGVNTGDFLDVETF